MSGTGTNKNGVNELVHCICAKVHCVCAEDATAIRKKLIEGERISFHGFARKIRAKLM